MYDQFGERTQDGWRDTGPELTLYQTETRARAEGLVYRRGCTETIILLLLFIREKLLV